MPKETKTIALSIALVVLGAFFGQGTAHAVPSACSSVNAVGGGVLWKPENVHGGRGGSFLLGCQVHRTKWPTNKSPLQIYDENGVLIGKLGLYDPGHHSYGRRYYMKVSGGSFTNVNVLKQRARKAGSAKIYIQGGVRGCWLVNDPTKREGSLTPQEGRGAC